MFLFAKRTKYDISTFFTGCVPLFTVRMLAPAESLKACVTCLVDEETLEGGKVTVLSFLLFLCSHCG